MVERKPVEQIPPPDRYNELRKELEAKIDSKLPHNFFWPLLTIIALVIGSIFAFGFQQFSRVGDKLDKIEDRMARIETRLDYSSSKRQIF